MSERESDDAGGVEARAEAARAPPASRASPAGLIVPRLALNSVDLGAAHGEESGAYDADDVFCARANNGAGSDGRDAASSGAPATDATSGSVFPVPSCAQAFTKEWVLFVMQRYYEQNYSHAIRDITRFAVESSEMDANSPMKDKHIDQLDQSPHALLSQAFKVVVEVEEPAPEPEQETTKKQKSSNDANSAHANSISGQVQGATLSAPTTPTATAKSPPASPNLKTRRKVHHLFVKIPPKRTAKFERMVRSNRTLAHEVKVYSEFLRDLNNFVKVRTGDTVRLNVPTLYHGYEDGCSENHALVIEDLTKKGFSTRDWFKHKLTNDEVELAIQELAKFHACGLAFRMGLKEELDEKYPYLEDDLYTSNMAKELLAKHLDSFLHFLSLLPGIQENVLKLRRISNEVFQLLVKLRRPSDPVGTRFNTVCHGDMWMGNLMFRSDPAAPDKPVECTIVDFHSAQFLSPATDLAHLLLTSTTREFRREHWHDVVRSYYDTFNRTMAEFGLILRHLGITYDDFVYEVKRALSGQFLCVAFIIPIVIYCGPNEWRFERRRGSSVDRKNTIRHLIQMMAITEEEHHDTHGPLTAPAAAAAAHATAKSAAPSDKEDDVLAAIPAEFVDLYKDKELLQILVDLINSASDLDILDFQEFCKNIDTPRPVWQKTKATTGKHKPVY